jgi:dTDP-D-glucose 4,6-dehydratase
VGNDSDIDTAQQVREERFPIVGTGDAVWSFVHIEDDAAAIVAIGSR